MGNQKGVKPRVPIQERRSLVPRHEARCRICGHARRDEIEQEFVNWTSPSQIAQGYKISRDSIYRHASAVGLFSRRQRNIRFALERIIEHAGEVEVNAAAVVSAIQAFAKINAQGQWIDRSDRVNLNEMFERMSRDELEAYAQDGELPSWFSQTIGILPATLDESQEVENAE
jgi:hypothetical protein